MKSCLELSNSRYTTKHYDKTKTVSAEHINYLKAVLRNTPSSLNSQPWHFVFIDNQKHQNLVLPTVADFNFARIIDSSHTIVFCYKTPLTKEHFIRINEKEAADGRYPSKEMQQTMLDGILESVFVGKAKNDGLVNWAKHQLYIALGQVMFATEELGIDSTAIGGFNSQKLDDALKLNEYGLKSEVLLTIGYRNENDGNATRPKSRLTDEELFTDID